MHPEKPRATDDFSLSGLVALVTGATRGIGRAIAEQFVQAGADVIVHGRDLHAARAVQADIGAADSVAADLSRPEEVMALCTELARTRTVLDVLVNNAGVEVGSQLEHVQLADLELTMRVNLIAPMLMTQGLLPVLRQSSWPSVLNISSIHESVPSWGNAAYSSSKAGLAMVTKTLAIELGPEGIRVNGLAPGAIATDINADVLAEIGEQSFREWIPLGRVGTPAEVAGPAVFLASRAAAYVNGSTLVVDGGYMHHLVRYRHSGHA